MADERRGKSQLARAELVGVADGLRALLRAIEVGEVEAKSGQVAHLEGALDVVDRLLDLPLDT